MKEHFCLDCNNVWYDVDANDHCPECLSPDIEVDNSGDDWMDGHYEGDMPSSISDKYMGDD